MQLACYHDPGWSGIIIVNIDNEDPFKLDAAIERSATSGGGGRAAAIACLEKARRQFSKIATNSQTLSALLLDLTFGEDNRHIQVLQETCHLASQPSGTINFISSGQVPPRIDKSVLIFAKASL